MTASTQASEPARKQGPPVAFRPGSELESAVATFATQHDRSLHIAFKDLASLAIAGLDHRHVTIMDEMAAAMGGANGFARACLHVDAALRGAVRARGGAELPEPDRSTFLYQTVCDFLRERGRQIPIDPVPPILSQGAEVPEPAAKASHVNAGPPRLRRRVSRRKLVLGEAERTRTSAKEPSPGAAGVVENLSAGTDQPDDATSLFADPFNADEQIRRKPPEEPERVRVKV